MRSRAAPAEAPSSFPPRTARASEVSIRLPARARAASSTSRTITGIPATATASAMPVPMNPAPTTATDSISDMVGSLMAMPLLRRVALDRQVHEPVEQLRVGIPLASNSDAYTLVLVNPGIVLSSLSSTRSPSTKKSTRASP